MDAAVAFSADKKPLYSFTLLLRYLMMFALISATVRSLHFPDFGSMV
jgi:hypothetical protein